MNPQLEISSLFKENPEFHMCLDGCTTILDAYYANLDTITLGRFNEFNDQIKVSWEIKYFIFRI